MRNGNILLWQRPPDAAILSGFWELPEPHQLPKVKPGAALHRFKHSITNHIYHFEVFAAAMSRGALPEGIAWRWVAGAELAGIPLSTTARKALAGLAQGNLFQ
jgi:hypothetical protein